MWCGPLTAGLPIHLLLQRAIAVRKHFSWPLDVVLSYSHMTLQNATLPTLLPAFAAAGVHRVITGSPLSMGLIRLEGPHDWHPASNELRTAVKCAAEWVETQGENFAEMGMRYVFAQWEGTIIGGYSSVEELEHGVEMWHRVKRGGGREEDKRLWAGAREVMGSNVDTMWSSPEVGWKFNDGTTFHGYT
jgi:D-arabinose 1-dehydrogenase